MRSLRSRYDDPFVSLWETDEREGLPYQPRPEVRAVGKFQPNVDNPTIYYYKVERSDLAEVLGDELAGWPDTLWIRACDGAVYGNQWGDGKWLDVLHIAPTLENDDG